MTASTRAVHVIMTCHNRREFTTRAARRIAASAAFAGAPLTITVFDDGSTDGTTAALRQLDLGVRILHGDGSAFWASGMAAAEAAVLRRDDIAEEDLLLWLNDDVDPDSGVISNLLDAASGSPDAVLVGALRDPDTGDLTYSAMMRTGIHPLRVETLPPRSSARRADTFNGNLVAVPIQVARRLGGIDGGFSHAVADIDYGFRCRRAGIPVLLLPGTQGTCARNPPPPDEPALEAWRRFTGVKGGGHYASLRRILRKSNPRTWLLWIGATYAKWWLTQAINSVRKWAEDSPRTFAAPKRGTGNDAQHPLTPSGEPDSGVGTEDKCGFPGSEFGHGLAVPERRRTDLGSRLPE